MKKECVVGGRGAGGQLLQLAFSLQRRLLSTPSSSPHLSLRLPLVSHAGYSLPPHYLPILSLKVPASLPHPHLSLLASSLPCRLLFAPSSSFHLSLKAALCFSVLISSPTLLACLLPLVSLKGYYPPPSLHPISP